MSLSQSTIEKLKYYVYLLIDPKGDKIFYVGKGKGSRINHHLLGALDQKTKETEKIKRIRKIEKSGKVKHVVLRHGLTEKEALEVESAIIDILGKNNLTNIVKGHNSEDRGVMDLEDIKIKYQAKEASFDESAILFNINQLFRRDMSYAEIYDATRKSWGISQWRRDSIKIACSVYRGIIREVFIITKWRVSPEDPKKYIFTGNKAPKNIRNKYLNKDVSKYWKKGVVNSFRYSDSLD